jgi:hypothetical protein
MPSKAKRLTLKQRALAIIDNPNRYDQDTRHAVRHALEREGPDLAEYVRRAEHGDTILDLVKPLEGAPDQGASDEQEEAAEQSGTASAMNWRDGNNSVPRLTIERARELVHRILQSDDDEEARALIELVTGIAYEPDAGHRDGLGLCATHEAYSLTMEFSKVAERFATRAATRHQNRKEES